MKNTRMSVKLGNAVNTKVSSDESPSKRARQKGEHPENEPNSEENSKSTVEVLYQKMGDRWFAFSLIDDEVFVGSIAQGEIDCSENIDPK
jgi:hypothetical protein